MAEAYKGEDKKWIDEANRRMAIRGKKSRYIDEAPEVDYTLADDVQAADRVDPVNDIPHEILVRGEMMRRETVAELQRRGIIPGGKPVEDPKANQSRIEVVKKFITMCEQMGSFDKAQQYRLELEELTNGQQ